MLQACVAPLCALQAGLPPDLAWLTPSEAARHQAFSLPARRQVFLAGRWLLRRVLAQALGGVDPAALGVALDAQLRSHCEGQPDWRLSLSHSGAWLGVAISDGAPLGLDIEQEKPDRDWCALSEHLALDCTTAADFYRHWTLGEAWLKASPQALQLHEVQALRWRADAQGPGWHGESGAEGLHIGLICNSPPQWLALYGPPPDWRDGGRWAYSTPKSK